MQLFGFRGQSHVAISSDLHIRPGRDHRTFAEDVTSRIEDDIAIFGGNHPFGDHCTVQKFLLALQPEEARAIDIYSESLRIRVLKG